MYKSFSCDKNSMVGSENAFSGRNNIPPKIPVVITTMGEENHQNRIQLAVHKYNSSASGLFTQSRNLMSPAKHTFLKNTLKSNNYEEDSETPPRGDRKYKTLYEGVGAFPTIHLKKSAIQYRPVKRFNEVKVLNPELPLCRFFNNLPEFSPEAKSSTRSVLDVLQDLSSKKINLNESKDCCKGMSKGLGGDLVVNGEAVYKPLFVQKPKSHSVLTRDNTTQTLLSQESNARSFTVSDQHKSIAPDDPSDHRLQLRKKLAKQNNEISASLSSSIPILPTKRKLDKVLSQENNENLNGASDVKRVKVNDHQLNGLDKNTAKFNKVESSNHLTTLKKKSKLNEITTSPNKDRLTTIFLDMQNISPKTQMFQNNLNSGNSSGPNDSQSLPDLQGNLSNKNESEPPDNKKIQETSFPTSLTSTLPSFTFTKSETISESNKTVNKSSETSSSCISENPLIKKTISEPEKQLSEKPASDPTALSNNLNVQNNFPLFSKTDSPLVINSQNSSELSKDTNKKPLTSAIDKNNESVVDKIKFAVEDNSKMMQNNPLVPNFNLQDKNQFGKFSSTSTDIKNPIKLDSTLQFNFEVKKLDPKMLTTGLITSTTSTTTTTSKNELSDPPKSSFTFGQSSTSFSLASNNDKEEKKEANSVLNSKSAFNNTTSPFFGTFGETPTFSFGKKSDEEKTNASSSTNTSAQAASVTNIVSEPFSSQTNMFTRNPAFQTSTEKNNENVVTFGEKPKPSEVYNSISNSGEKKTQPLSPFAFEQKGQDMNFPKGNEVGLNNSKKPNEWFTFGQKTLKPETAQNSTSPVVNSLNQFNTAPGVPQILPKLPSQTSLFSQSSSPTTSPRQTTTQGTVSTQNQNLLTDSTTVCGSKPESKEQTTAPFLNKTPFFGSSGPVQSSTTSSISNGSFGTVNSTQSSSVFGVKSTTAQAPVLATSTASPSLGFGGNQALNAFGAPPATKSSGFGAEAKPFGFKTSLSPSSGNTFITPTSVQANKPFAFGSSSSAFGQPSEQICNKTPNSLGSTANIFSQTTTSQNSAENNAFGAPNFGASSSQNMFGSKVESPPSVFGHNSKNETLAFNQSIQSQAVDTQNKFSFGTSAASPSGFSSNLSNSSATPVFNFGGASAHSSASSFSFGSSVSTSNNPNNQFSFKNPTSDTFKFGTPNTKDNNVFGNPSTPAFSFNNQLNNNSASEPKPPPQTFNFGSNPTMSTTSAFNLNSSSTPSVFNFGGSGSSVSSNSGFNFGTPQPCSPFGQPAMPSMPPFSGPGTFSIGSGSSQSRPKASSRLRRRP